MEKGVMGHSPRSAQGIHFCTSLHGWRFIRALIELINSQYDNSLIDSKTLESMLSKDGAGLRGEQASVLADAVQAVLDDEDNSIDVFQRAVMESRLYEAGIELARDFCHFLRNCGGVSVADSVPIPIEEEIP